MSATVEMEQWIVSLDLPRTEAAPDDPAGRIPWVGGWKCPPWGDDPVNIHIVHVYLQGRKDLTFIYDRHDFDTGVKPGQFIQDSILQIKMTLTVSKPRSVAPHQSSSRHDEIDWRGKGNSVLDFRCVWVPGMGLNRKGPPGCGDSDGVDSQESFVQGA